MIFYYDINGSPISSEVERVYQGSIKANRLIFVGPFDKMAEVCVSFEREDGYVSTLLPLTRVSDNSINAYQLGIDAERINVWTIDLESAFTKIEGMVNVQFYIYYANGETLATAMSYFMVEKGLEPVLPEEIDEMQQVYNYLAGINQNLEEIKESIADISATSFRNGDGEGSVIMKGTTVDGTTYPNNQAQGIMALAVGNNCVAKGNFSIAGGKECTANENYNLCVGLGLTSDRVGQTAVGVYNKPNTSAVFIVGSGAGDKFRKNALEINNVGEAKFFSDTTIRGNLTITKNLTVSGDTTFVDTETLKVKDNVIVTNSDKVNLVDNSGIVINKGTNDVSGSSYGIVYSPTENAVLLGGGNLNSSNKFEFTENEGFPVVVREHSQSIVDGQVMVWDATNNRLKGSSDYVTKTTYCDKTSNLNGLVKPNGEGVYVEQGVIKISPASNEEITAKTNAFKPIVPKNISQAVKVALVNPGGDNGVTWQDDDKQKARETLGVNANSLFSDMAKLIYPVGSIYMNTLDVSPATIFGGTWERLQNRFLLGASNTYPLGSTGGSADAVVVSHTHSVECVEGGSGVPYKTRVTKVGTGDGVIKYDLDMVGLTGVSAEGKNMPPYLTVYMWKRTA